LLCLYLYQWMACKLQSVVCYLQSMIVGPDSGGTAAAAAGTAVGSGRAEVAGRGCGVKQAPCPALAAIKPEDNRVGIPGTQHVQPRMPSRAGSCPRKSPNASLPRSLTNMLQVVYAIILSGQQARPTLLAGAVPGAWAANCLPPPPCCNPCCCCLTLRALAVNVGPSSALPSLPAGIVVYA
jgi:hypothetical protein